MTALQAFSSWMPERSAMLQSKFDPQREFLTM